MSGTKGHSGRRARTAARRYGEVWVRLSKVRRVTVNGVTFDHQPETPRAFECWHVNDSRFDDYAAAAAEFVRRVNAMEER